MSEIKQLPGEFALKILNKYLRADDHQRKFIEEVFPDFEWDRMRNTVIRQLGEEGFKIELFFHVRSGSENIYDVITITRKIINTGNKALGIQIQKTPL